MVVTYNPMSSWIYILKLSHIQDYLLKSLFGSLLFFLLLFQPFKIYCWQLLITFNFLQAYTQTPQSMYTYMGAFIVVDLHKNAWPTSSSTTTSGVRTASLVTVAALSAWLLVAVEGSSRFYIHIM